MVRSRISMSPPLPLLSAACNTPVIWFAVCPGCCRPTCGYGASEAPVGFDARFSALRRHYVYRVTTATAYSRPVRVRDTARWRRPIDLDKVKAASEVLVGLNDFAAFCKAREGATTIRELQQFQWFDVSTPAEPETYEARVAADAFCWSMVRSLVGAVLTVGREAGWRFHRRIAEAKRAEFQSSGSACRGVESGASGLSSGRRPSSTREGYARGAHTRRSDK